MSDAFAQWLLLAGPVWAAIGLFLLPRVGEKRKRDAEINLASLQVAGVVSGFALGPLDIKVCRLELEGALGK